MANSWDEAAVRELSRLPTVDRAFGLGSVLALEMKAATRGYGIEFYSRGTPRDARTFV